jgi:hypothetical protein
MAEDTNRLSRQDPKHGNQDMKEVCGLLSEKYIRDNILFALFVFDHIQEIFYELHPLSVSFLQVSLSF